MLARTAPYPFLALLALLIAGAAAARAQEEPGSAPEDRITRRAPEDRITRRPPAKKPPPVNMVVHLGLEGYARRDGPVPVRVVLDNGPKAYSGRLVLRVRDHVTETSVELPRQAHKEYTLHLPSWPVERDEYARSDYQGHEPPLEGEIALYAGRSRLAVQALKPEFPEEEALVLSATGDGSGLQFLNQEKASRYGEEGRKFRVTHASAQDLPRQWSGYAAADVVALNGRAWSGMDDAQRRALRIWIEQGGRAVLCGESVTEWRDAEAEALTGVVPQDLASRRELNAVTAWGGRPYRAAEGTLLTVSGPLAPNSSALYSEAGEPLIAARRAGRGQVVWIGFDPFRQTLREWEGYGRFWQSALERARTTGAAEELGAIGEMEEAVEAASALPRLPAPPLPVIIGFGVLYAVIFGPVNIWMLRRLRRTVRAWLFVPALALAMTLVVLTLGQSWGKGRAVLNNVALLQTAAGSRTGAETSLTGIFSPTNAAFDLSVEDPAPSLQDRGSPMDGPAVGELPWPDQQADGGVRWSRVPLQLYSVRLLELSRPRDLGGAVTARLRSERGAPPVGIVRNGTSLTLQGTALAHGKRYHPLPELKPGMEAPVTSKGWTEARPPAPELKTAGSGLLENERFQGSQARLWDRLVQRTDAGKSGDAAWLLAGCEGLRGGFEVAALPHSNRAALVRVRLPLGTEE